MPFYLEPEKKKEKEELQESQLKRNNFGIKSTRKRSRKVEAKRIYRIYEFGLEFKIGLGIWFLEQEEEKKETGRVV